uniref:Uncharacterized protein n=1 Tax=Lactuca sativa TaxID=4236 RepID=A0A9R1VMQ1_LACSA|nr:hypothetical protein LSAT_V11C400189450 [Lactuca sativa]
MGDMDIYFGNTKLRIKVFNMFPNSPSDYECYWVDVINVLVHQFTPKILHPNSLELFLSNDRDEVLYLEDIKMVDEEYVKYMDQGRRQWSHQIEKLPTIIVSSGLTCLKEESLLKCKGPTWWTIVYFKGVSPTTWMHRIITDAGVNPSQDTQ